SREDGVLDSNDRLLEDVDRNIVEDVTKFLFQPPDAPRGSGFDLVALNIQRGRDHGLPPYTKFRNFCGLRPLTGFNDVEALGPFVAELGNVYESVDDIDLFTGLLHEPATNDTGIVGPTLACLLVTQFSHLKSGDRFFFDTSKEEFGFTDDQLANIRETTLASVMCENLRIPQLPENVFIQASNKNNKLVNCRKLKGTLDLRLFRE
ncbi:peroxidase-like protein, partial [Aplysia californica]|uniref:Peroxidase-like protein n=1 Tax=Aplysia californica TaxID=6500 RepID=A0ABM1A637_APLCA